MLHAALLLIGLAAPAGQDTADLSYILPKTRVTAAVAQRLVTCPPDATAQAKTADGLGDPDPPPFTVEYTPTIGAKAAADRLVTVDARSGFLVDRTTKLVMTEDGLLKQYNASATGQGGPLIVSLVKAAAFAYGIVAAPPLAAAAAAVPVPKNNENFEASLIVRKRPVTLYFLQCRADVADRMARLHTTEDLLGKLQAKAAAGAADDTDKALIAQLTMQRDDLVGMLTLTSELDDPLVPSVRTGAALADGAQGLVAFLPPSKFDDWFEVVPRQVMGGLLFDPPTQRSVAAMLARIPRPGHAAPQPMVGLYGYRLSLKPDAQQFGWFGCGGDGFARRCGAHDHDDSTIVTRDLQYRRPVPAAAALAPLYAACTADPCTKAPDDWAGADNATTKLAVRLPQLSRLYALPTGASIFGSRTVGAEFGAYGEPLTLQYDKGGGGKDAASIIDAVTAAGPSIRDARLDALKRQLDQRKTQKDLDDLINAKLDTPE